MLRSTNQEFPLLIYFQLSIPIKGIIFYVLFLCIAFYALYSMLCIICILFHALYSVHLYSMHWILRHGQQGI